MTETADFFRARLDEMVDHSHPLVWLSKRLPWGAIEQALAPHFARKARPGLLMQRRTCSVNTKSNSARASAPQVVPVWPSD